jgi:hypothetical protein
MAFRSVKNDCSIFTPPPIAHSGVDLSEDLIQFLFLLNIEPNVIFALSQLTPRIERPTPSCRLRPGRRPETARANADG